MDKKKWTVLSILFLMIVGIIFLERKEITETGVWFMEKVKGLYDDIYKCWADLRGLDWRLIKAVAQTESDETPSAIGDDGRSFGMMQVSLLVGSSYGMSKEDLLDPNLNVQVGSGFLKEMIDKFGLEGGIQAYNLGETKYRQGYKSPTYLSKVLDHYNTLQIEV